MSYGVTNTATRATRAVQAITQARIAKGLPAQQNRSQARKNRLKGEMEHASHEIAVNRYMTGNAKDRQLRADRVFGASVVAALLLLAVLFVIANLA